MKTAALQLRTMGTDDVLFMTVPILSPKLYWKAAEPQYGAVHEAAATLLLGVGCPDMEQRASHSLALSVKIANFLED